MKFNQFVDDAAEKFEVVKAVNIADLAKQAQLQLQFSQLQSEYNNYFHKLFINGKEFTHRRLDFRDLINPHHLRKKRRHSVDSCTPHSNNELNFYTKSLKIFIRNSPLQYTITQTNTTLLLSLHLYTNATNYQ